MQQYSTEDLSFLKNLEITYTCQLLHKIWESVLKVMTKVSPKRFQYAIQLWNMQKVTWKPLIKMHSTNLKEKFKNDWMKYGCGKPFSTKSLFGQALNLNPKIQQS